MLLLTMPGIPTVYYGDEIGMENGDIPPHKRNDWSNQDGSPSGRDPERTPMQWDDSKYAGFSTTEPWLPVSKNYRRVNVVRERHHADSFLTLYRHLLVVRNRDETMVKGDYKQYAINEKQNVLVYERSHRRHHVHCGAEF